MTFDVGGGYGIPSSSNVPRRAFAITSASTWGSVSVAAGRDGLDLMGARPSASAVVRSPVTLRRHADRFGTVTPKRVSMNCRVEVWSKVSLARNPPRVKGDIRMHGTRKPRPTGPTMPPAVEGSGFTVRYSPAVPGGAVGGGTW